MNVPTKEVIVIAKILIKRRFKEVNTRQIVALFNEIWKLALTQPGYQSGETLMKNDQSNQMVVISTWNSLDEWYSWRDNPDRKKFEAMLEVYQEGPTEYDEYLLGTPLQPEKG
jgi:heme-degrading monooxygenase HmoA